LVLAAQIACFGHEFAEEVNVDQRRINPEPERTILDDQWSVDLPASQFLPNSRGICVKCRGRVA
jgi:hypothetical protein